MHFVSVMCLFYFIFYFFILSIIFFYSFISFRLLKTCAKFEFLKFLEIFMFKIKENVEKEGKKIECVCINLKDDKRLGGK